MGSCVEPNWTDLNEVGIIEKVTEGCWLDLAPGGASVAKKKPILRKRRTREHIIAALEQPLAATKTADECSLLLGVE